MALADKEWKPTTVHVAVLDFLRAERHKYQAIPADLQNLIDRPDLANPVHNHTRLRLLYATRRGLFGEVPPDTAWFEIDGVTQADLDNVHVIARAGWEDPSDKNEVLNVAKRRHTELRTPPATWPRPLLFAHDRDGPFTILEGNNRMVTFAAHGAGQTINVLVGLSPTICYWHGFDPARPLLHGLWISEEKK